MKIKIKHRWNLNHIEGYEPEENKEFYDVYHGFSSWFRTKWMGARYGLTEEELSKYIDELVIKLRNNVKIIWDL